MTKREFLNAVIAETKNADLALYAVEELEKLDARNAKRAEKPSKRAIENEPIKARIAEVLTDTPQTASEIANILDLKVQKVSALLKQIDGIKICKVKVKGKGEQNGYSL